MLTRLGASLPDIPPGALPALKVLSLHCDELLATLPASWGSSPRVLPALEQLSVVMQVEGGLPEEWSKGLNQLQSLTIVNTGWPHLPGEHLAWAGPGPAGGHPGLAAADPSEAAGGGDAGMAEAALPAGAGAEAGAGLAAAAPAPVPASTPEESVQTAAAAAAVPSPAEAGAPLPRLPESWAGSFPFLRFLTLSRLHLAGSLPDAWVRRSGFPEIAQL